jgi:hypothetical protein
MLLPGPIVHFWSSLGDQQALYAVDKFPVQDRRIKDPAGAADGGAAVDQGSSHVTLVIGALCSRRDCPLSAADRRAVSVHSNVSTRRFSSR